MNIKIISKKTGIGNQIQFIPCINYLKTFGYVYTDSPIYCELGICPIDTVKPDLVYFVYNYRRNWILKEWIKYPFAKYCGYVGKKSKIVKLLLSKWLHMNSNYTELYNNTALYVPNIFPYFLRGKRSQKNKIALIVSHKWNKYYEHWQELENLLIASGFEVVQLGEKETNNYKCTATILDLKNELCNCSFHISTDSGPAHLADILGIPGITIWGASELRGALQHSTIIMGLNTDASRILSEVKKIKK